MNDVRKPPSQVATLAAQGLGAYEPDTKGIVPSIHLATTYLRDSDNGYRSGHVYGRTDNPSVQHAQALITALEDGDDGLLFASGMAAATTVLLALERPTHIIASAVMYYGFSAWLRDAGRYGHTITFVETSDLAAVARAVRPGETGLVWIESPSNPQWTITDIAAVADIAHAAGALLCVDSTVSTPVFTRPLQLGADIVMHSATKYLNGHSDVVAGALVVRGQPELWAQIVKVRHDHGTTLGPFEAWLLTRGIRTLDVRVRRQAQTASRLAQALTDHPAVSCVLYPGLASHPGHAIAARQMKGGFGGMLSIRIAQGEQAAIAVAANVRVWKRATSLGGVESLIEHRSSIEGEGSSCPSDLLRLSVGLEDFDDLQADLLQALDAVRRPALEAVTAQALTTVAGSASATVAVAIMCKTPMPGASKTRLSPPLLPDECAEISRCFIRDLARTIDTLAKEGEASAHAVYTPAGTEPQLRQLLSGDFHLTAQADGDFGQRLLQGVRDLLAAGHRGVILVNSDSPTLPLSILRDAVAAVRRGDNVTLSPALDGGYTLIGLSQAHARLFEDIPWSTADVYRQTVQRAHEIGLKVEVVGGWYDVDDADSLRMLEDELQGRPMAFAALPADPSEASATRAFLHERAVRRAAGTSTHDGAGVHAVSRNGSRHSDANHGHGQQDGLRAERSAMVPATPIEPILGASKSRALTATGRR